MRLTAADCAAARLNLHCTCSSLSALPCRRCARCLPRSIVCKLVVLALIRLRVMSVACSSLSLSLLARSPSLPEPAAIAPQELLLPPLRMATSFTLAPFDSQSARGHSQQPQQQAHAFVPRPPAQPSSGQLTGSVSSSPYSLRLPNQQQQQQQQASYHPASTQLISPAAYSASAAASSSSAAAAASSAAAAAANAEPSPAQAKFFYKLVAR